MAQQAKFGLMIWDGKSSGTVLNILRLVRASKKAVLVSVAEGSEVEFKSKEDWDTFLSRCSLKLRRDMERRAIQDELFMLRPEQDQLNFSHTDEPTEGVIAWSELIPGLDAIHSWMWRRSWKPKWAKLTSFAATDSRVVGLTLNSCGSELTFTSFQRTSHPLEPDS